MTQSDTAKVPETTMREVERLVDALETANKMWAFNARVSDGRAEARAALLAKVGEIVRERDEATFWRNNWEAMSKQAATAVDALRASLAEAKREQEQMCAALKPFAHIPFDAFNNRKPTHPLMGWNDHTIYVRDVIAARAALAAAGNGGKGEDERFS